MIAPGQRHRLQGLSAASKLKPRPPKEHALPVVWQTKDLGRATGRWAGAEKETHVVNA